MIAIRQTLGYRFPLAAVEASILVGGKSWRRMECEYIVCLNGRSFTFIHSCILLKFYCFSSDEMEEVDRGEGNRAITRKLRRPYTYLSWLVYCTVGVLLSDCSKSSISSLQCLHSVKSLTLHSSYQKRFSCSIKSYQLHSFHQTKPKSKCKPSESPLRTCYDFLRR